MLRNMYVDRQGKVYALAAHNELTGAAVDIKTQANNLGEDRHVTLTFIGTINDVQHKYVEIDEEYRSHDM